MCSRHLKMIHCLPVFLVKMSLLRKWGSSPFWGINVPENSHIYSPVISLYIVQIFTSKSTGWNSSSAMTSWQKKRRWPTPLRLWSSLTVWACMTGPWQISTFLIRGWVCTQNGRKVNVYCNGICIENRLLSDGAQLNFLKIAHQLLAGTAVDFFYP